jgi:hypothetical protein
MTTTAAPLVHSPAPVTPELVRTARTTGLLYLGLAVTGMLSYLLVRPQLVVDGDPAATLANLTEQASLARLGVVLELGIVLTQALCALWFFRLFRSVDAFAAGCIAVFGVVNATAIMGSAAALGAAVEVSGGALGAGADAAGGTAAAVGLLYLVSEQLWVAGAIFFGLWLIPMGWLARRSGWMPSALGWVLMVGGVGYVLSAFVPALADEAGAIVDVLTIPATIGELWMIGSLLVVGVRRSPTATT